MSLILDALNRAERERKKSQPIPDLQTVHEPASPAEAEPTATNKWLFVAVVLIALIAMIVLVQQLPGSVQERSVKSVAVADPGADLQSGKDTLKALAPEAEAPVRVDASGPQAEMIAPPIAPKIPNPAKELTELYAAARAEEEQIPDVVDDLYVAPHADSGRTQESVSETIAAPAIVARTYDSLIEIPDLGDLPSGLRQQIPTLNYVRHNFDESGITSVVINGRAHNAGASLAPELVLEEIYSDGVIFRFKEIRFKLRALNSWINM